jgi:hypothetical protein
MIQNKLVCGKVPTMAYITLKNYDKLVSIQEQYSKSNFINMLIEKEYERRNGN